MEALVQNFYAIRKLQVIQRNNDNGSDNQIFNTWTIEHFCKYMHYFLLNDIMAATSADRVHWVFIILGQNMHAISAI